MGIALYIHVPFCARRCNYCGFCTWAGLQPLMRRYTAALAAELSWLTDWGDRRASSGAEGKWATSLYLGGGTPSLLSSGLLLEILGAAPVAEGAETTMEANPDTVERADLLALRRGGVNRLSLGMQSANPRQLALLGRKHDFAAVAGAMQSARSAGLDNVNLDLIYGIPGQGLKEWQQSLEAALSLAPEHLSLYALSVEPGTELAGWIERGDVSAPDSDLAADMYEAAGDILTAGGYSHYEISNWALPGRECAHNLAYWRNDPYLGAGAGAWGHWPEGETSWRLRNEADPEAYIERCSAAVPEQGSDLPVAAACSEKERVGRRLAMAETMFMGLRLLQEGVSRTAFQSRFGTDPVGAYRETLERLSRVGLVEWDDQRVRLLPQAELIGNQVFAEFLPEPEEVEAGG